MRVFRGLLAALSLILPLAAAADPGTGSVLPDGTDFGGESLDQPHEMFHSEQIAGRKSYLSILGNLAFNSSSILGGPARQAGMNCETCHNNGTGNPALFVPGMSTRPGTFDTTGPLFNPKADNGIIDAVTPPSLRGARLLAPYGHDGRMASLTDFIHNVIVNEFSGPQPSAEVLDAIVAYVEDIDFLPNRRLGQSGKLVGRTSDAEKRGEVLFNKPFAHDPSLSCAACHIPSAAFVDHRQHDVGSDGYYKTPTLLNVVYNAPYFHDGRYATLDEAVVHFDRMFYLGLSEQDRQDLVAYLKAIGGGEHATERDGVDLRLKQIDEFLTVLDTAIPGHDAPIVALAVDEVGGELRDLALHFPGTADTAVTGGAPERAAARGAARRLALDLRAVADAAGRDDFAETAKAFAAYRTERAAALPLLKAGEAWSLFDERQRTADLGATSQLAQAAVDPTAAPPRRIDND